MLQSEACKGCREDVRMTSEAIERFVAKLEKADGKMLVPEKIYKERLDGNQSMKVAPEPA
jgi:hypothetical protein